MTLAKVVREAQEAPGTAATCGETGLVAQTNAEGETSVGLIGDAPWLFIPLAELLRGPCLGLRGDALQLKVMNLLLDRWAGKKTEKEGATDA